MLRNFQNRLFVPLTKEAFEWFKLGKRWEVRKFNVGQYNLRNLQEGRETELRMGYRKGKSIWGKIREVRVFEDAIQLVEEIPYKMIIPSASSRDEAEEFIKKYVGSNHKIVAFKLELTNDDE